MQSSPMYPLPSRTKPEAAGSRIMPQIRAAVRSYTAPDSCPATHRIVGDHVIRDRQPFTAGELQDRRHRMSPSGLVMTSQIHTVLACRSRRAGRQRPGRRGINMLPMTR